MRCPISHLIILHLRTHFSPICIVTVHAILRVIVCETIFLWLSFWDTEMRKDSFGRNQHLLILRVHSISVTMDMRDSFPELWLLGFPVFCLLICSTVSHREGKKWKDVIFQGCFLSVTALLTVDILSRLWSFFQYLVLIFHQVRLPTQKAQNNHSDYFLS